MNCSSRRALDMPWRKTATLLLMAVLSLGLLLAAARPASFALSDPDFFWHLKTGEWIWEHKSLPREFLFSSTAPAVMTPDQRFTMTSYWLVQVLYHLVHAAGGMAGIAVLRFVLAALLVGSLVLRREGEDGLVFLGTLLLGLNAMRFYLFERPQVLSFIFFALLLWMLDGLRREGGLWGRPPAGLVGLPLVMVAWANSHGGFVLGQGVIVLYLVAEAVKFLHPRLRPLPAAGYRRLAGAGLAGLLASLLNPSFYRPALLTRLPEWLTSWNMEYQSTFGAYQRTSSPVVLVYWFLLLLALAALALRWRKPDITRLLLLAATGYLSFTQVRHIAFFVISAVPVIEGALSAERVRAAGRILVVVPALAAAALFLRSDLGALRGVRWSASVNPLVFPVDAADFVRDAGLGGNMYNFYGWGGYLLWRLYPSKVFIDGRNSDRTIQAMARRIDSSAEKDPREERRWRELIFRRYGIRYAIFPIFNSNTGEASPLLFKLMSDPGWAPVYDGVNSVVFVADVPENAEVIRSRAMPRQIFPQRLLRRCENLIRSFPGDPYPYMAKGDLLLWLGRTAEARAAYEAALRIIPFNPWLRQTVQRLGPSR